MVEAVTDEDTRKWETLLARLRDLRPLLVAYSGGVDSSLLLFAAREATPDGYLGVTAVSPSLASEQLIFLRNFVRDFELRHREVSTQELEDPNYQKNHGDRCYYCKTHLFTVLEQIAEAEGYKNLAYGEITDDAGDHRPGARAAQQFSVVAPLADAGLDKASIRRLSRSFGLPSWNHVAQPCLASRVAYFQKVDESKLSAIERGEALLRGMGFERCRLRHHDQIARLEIPLARFSEFLERREEVVSALRAEGFLFVTLDLEGLQSGSLNRLLTLPMSMSSHP